MRNAMICASAMLALFLLWPIVFGGAADSAAAAQPVPHRSAGVTMIVPPPAPVPTPRLIKASVVRTIAPASVSRPTARGGALETCTQHYARVAPTCTSAGCRMQAADGLDICQGTGFWPE